MKPKLGNYISKFVTCAQVTSEHQIPYGKSKSLQLGLKNGMQFQWISNIGVGLPPTSKDHDVIWIIVDGLTKSVIFLEIKQSTLFENLAKLHVDEVVKFHGVPWIIISL